MVKFRQILRNPVAIITLLINLIAGNFVVAVLNNMDFDSWLSMGPAYSVTAVFMLTLAFVLIKARYSWWKLCLLGFAVSMVILALGSALASYVITFGSGFVEVFGKAILLAIFSVIFGFIFTVPFIVGNTVAFFLYRNSLR